MPRRHAEPEPRLAETVALGLIHGPVELLPVSSSAHVELLPWLLGWEHSRLDGERRKEVAVALHAGTAVALGAFRGAAVLRRPWLPALAGVAPALAGLAFERPIERRLGTPRATALGLLAGSAALIAAEVRSGSRRGAQGAGIADALWLGAAQAAALIPGVSRSGATRAMARARGFTPGAAIDLSEEVALPVLAGAAALKGVRLRRRRPDRRAAATLAAGAIAAAASTAALLRFEHRFHLPPAVFAAYRVALAGFVWARSDRGLRDNRGR